MRYYRKSPGYSYENITVIFLEILGSILETFAVIDPDSLYEGVTVAATISARPRRSQSATVKSKPYW